MKSALRKAVLAGVISCVGLQFVVESASAATVQTAQPQLPRLGDPSPDVTRLQQAIVARGFTLRGGITGSFNEATRTALR
ncbi:MAG: peptidoglycan-binding domain-containing protein, partial [Ilumatobacteraceae bacterium]